MVARASRRTNQPTSRKRMLEKNGRRGASPPLIVSAFFAVIVTFFFLVVFSLVEIVVDGSRLWGRLSQVRGRTCVRGAAPSSLLRLGRTGGFARSRRTVPALLPAVVILLRPIPLVGWGVGGRGRFRSHHDRGDPATLIGAQTSHRPRPTDRAEKNS